MKNLEIFYFQNGEEKEKHEIKKDQKYTISIFSDDYELASSDIINNAICNVSHNCNRFSDAVDLIDGAIIK
jgi:hypothetical protein